MPEEVCLTSPCGLLKPMGFSLAQGTLCLHFYEQKYGYSPSLALGASPDGVRTGPARMDIEPFLSTTDGSSAHHTTLP